MKRSRVIIKPTIHNFFVWIDNENGPENDFSCMAQSCHWVAFLPFRASMFFVQGAEMVTKQSYIV